MLFNPDPKKPAQEVLCSTKTRIENHPTISLNNIPVERTIKTPWFNTRRKTQF